MNKRQAKKAYKKKYGFNPPKDKEYATFLDNFAFPAAAAYREYVNRIVDDFTEAIKRVIPAITAAVNAAIDTAKEAIENIKTMPEEDFNRILESSDLDERTKALARQIRSSGQYGLYNSNASETRRDSEGSYTAAGTGDNNELHGSRADNAAGNKQRYNNATGSSPTNAAAPGFSNCERSYGSDN